MNEKTQCYQCGLFYPDSLMADWTICVDCKQAEMERLTGEAIYIDSLGIAWTETQLKEAGGKEEVEKLSKEADARRNLTRPSSE